MRSRTIPALLAMLCVLTPTRALLAQAPGQEPQQQLVSNVFLDTDVRQALADIAAAAKVTIVPDESVQGAVSCELKEAPLERALDIVLASGGFTWRKFESYYLVGRAEPTNPNFLLLASTRVYKPNFLTAERLASILPQAMAAYVKAAPQERAMTITASSAMIERIMADVKALDVAPQRVILEALVTEVSTETLNQFGLSWVWKYFGVKDTAEPFELKYSEVAADDVATMKALIGKGKAEVRANPRIMTVDGKEALIEIAQESYFQVVTGPVNFPYTTLQQIKTGISLKITPFLSEDGHVTIQMAPEVSDATGSGPGGLPINTVRRANTTVRVKAGETIIIGGMSYESKRRRESKVPILGDIPLIGQLFRSSRIETKKTEVVIMITPRIVPESKDEPKDSKPGAAGGTHPG